MTMLIHEAHLEEQLIAERRATGADRFDEVWEGVYVMAPFPNDEHQELVVGLSSVLQVLLEWGARGAVRAGVYVSDREVGWTKNYRCPDVAVFLPSGKAKNCGTHWCGGPDFTVEILSPDDQSREKLPFYGAIGTRELLLIDRQDWSLEMYNLTATGLLLSARSVVGDDPISSSVLPISVRLLAGEFRPRIEVLHADGQQRWLL